MINSQIGKQIKIRDCNIEQNGNRTTCSEEIIIKQVAEINKAIEDEIFRIVSEFVSEAVTDVILIDRKVVKEMAGKYCIPFKPFVNNVGNNVQHICKCGKLLLTLYGSGRYQGERSNYCKNCGQLLDWEVDED